MNQSENACTSVVGGAADIACLCLIVCKVVTTNPNVPSRCTVLSGKIMVVYCVLTIITYCCPIVLDLKMNPGSTGLQSIHVQ